MTSSPSITTQDVAQAARVSVGTVSRVLTNQPNVDEKLRDRVLAVVSELGYIHNPRRRRSSEQSQDEVGAGEKERVKNPLLRTILFCVPVRKTPAIQEAYYYQVLHGVEDECTTHKVGVMYNVMADSAVSIDQVKDLIDQRSATGILLVTYSSRELVNGLKETGIPTVLIDPLQPLGLEVDMVSSDFYNSSLDCMQYLLDLGHKNIALVNGPRRYSSQQRAHAYRIALEEAGITYKAEMIASNDQTVEGGEEAIRELLSSGQKFSAVCCANDNMGLGAIRALASAGLRVPEDVSVIGFDDHGTATMATPPLTTFNANTIGKGIIGVRRLLERVAQPDTPYVWSVLPAHLVERASTAPFRQSQRKATSS